MLTRPLRFHAHSSPPCCSLTFRYDERVREPTAKARALRSKVEGMPTSFATLFNSFVPKAEAQGKLSRANLQRLLKEYLRAGECSFIYRYILREYCSQFDSLPSTSLSAKSSTSRASPSTTTR